MTQQVEDARQAESQEWYAINSEHQRVVGPFRTEHECAQAVAQDQERRRWDVVPLLARN